MHETENANQLEEGNMAKEKKYTSDQVRRIAEAAAKYGAQLALEEFAAANRIAPDVKQKLQETAKNIRQTFDE